jgi:hypothetical protein
MAIVVLNAGDRAQLSSEPVTLKLDVEGAAQAGDLDLSPSSPAARPRRGMIVLPKVSGRIVVFARPQGADGAAFPSPTRLHLSVEDGLGANRVLVQAVDAAGLSRCDLLVIEPCEQGLVVYREQQLPDEPLSELATAARVQARRALGARQLGGADARQVSLLVDGSASMWPRVEDGTVRAIVEVLVGIVQVLSPGKRFTSVAVGHQRRKEDRFAGAGPVQIGEAIEAAMTERASSTGFRSARSAPPAVAGELLYVLTDEVPVDLDDLRRGRDAPGAGAHVIVMAPGSVADVVRPQLPASSTFVEVAGGDMGCAGRLLSDRASLGQLVADLLSDLPAGAASGGRGLR